MINAVEWKEELAWLEQVRGLIWSQLCVSEEQVIHFREKLLATNWNMWKDVLSPTGDFEEDFEMIVHTGQYLKERTNLIVTYEFYQQIVQRLKRMHAAPYFGRIDFHEQGKDEAEAMYIGIATFFDEQESCLIYDWRAPVSSMFYDFGPGPARYECKEGAIQGEMLRKRQYRIVDGVLQFMFDTNLKIDDEILQQILSQSATGKMKQIVTSIQQEQNRVIRNDDQDLLIVQGPAGSGKTSIALHRAAYLLYKYRDRIHSENILIFSPNRIFSDYISNVLPELGEENVVQLTLQEYAASVLGERFRLEEVYDQLEYFFSAPLTEEYRTRIDSVRFKSSQKYVQMIRNYIARLEQEHGQRFEPVVYQDEEIVSAAQLRYFWNEYQYLPLRKRLKKIRRRIYTMLKPIKKKRIHELKQQLDLQFKKAHIDWFKEAVEMVQAELEPLYQKLDEWMKLDPFELYAELFRSPEAANGVAEGDLPERWNAIAQQTQKAWEEGWIPYEDVAPLVIFHRAMTGEGRLEEAIKHIFIDEAQDYSPFQYELIHRTFPQCKLTLLGDVNQLVHPYLGTADYQTIAEIFGLQKTEMIRLEKSYRSTHEIAAFAQQILQMPEDHEMINRRGEKPQLTLLTERDVQPVLLHGIAEMRAKGAKSIGIVARTAAEAAMLHHLLQDHLSIHLVTKEDGEFTRDAVVIPSYLAKGLEFDAVLVYLGSADAYPDHEMNLLYMVCTRALHYLHLYQVGSSSPWIERMNPEVYAVNRG